MEAPASTLQKVSVFSATLQITSVFSATIKVSQICLRQESCTEHIDSQQLSSKLVNFLICKGSCIALKKLCHIDALLLSKDWSVFNNQGGGAFSRFNPLFDTLSSIQNYHFYRCVDKTVLLRTVQIYCQFQGGMGLVM